MALRDRVGERVPFRVVSGSMRPLIPVGASVVVEIGADVRPGDVVLFWDGARPVCHVLWHKNRVPSATGKAVYLTCGLEGRGLDLAVEEDRLLGRVISHHLTWWHKIRLSLRRARESRGR